jgi:hypothetical protein
VLAIVGVGGLVQFKTALTLDTYFLRPGLTPRQACIIPLGFANHGQHIFGQGQQALALRGKTDGLGLADEERTAQPLFKILDLMGKGRLGQVHPLSGFNQAAGIAQGCQSLEMP